MAKYRYYRYYRKPVLQPLGPVRMRRSVLSRFRHQVLGPYAWVPSKRETPRTWLGTLILRMRRHHAIDWRIPRVNGVQKFFQCHNWVIVKQKKKTSLSHCPFYCWRTRPGNAILFYESFIAQIKLIKKLKKRQKFITPKTTHCPYFCPIPKSRKVQYISFFYLPLPC